MRRRSSRHRPSWSVWRGLLFVVLVLAVLGPTSVFAQPDDIAPQSALGSEPDAFLPGLFAEPTLDQLVAYADSQDQGDIVPWRQYRRARDAVERGDRNAALSALRELTTRPDTSTAVILWTWANLRRLGESPPASVADQVLGVVYEVPVDTGIEYMGAYADGRWRIVRAEGGGVFWETPEDPQSTEITDFIVAAGQRMLYWTPAAEARDESRPEAIRVTLLTLGGPRQVLLDRPSFDEGAPTRRVASALIEGFSRLMNHARDVADSES